MALQWLVAVGGARIQRCLRKGSEVQTALVALQAALRRSQVTTACYNRTKLPHCAQKADVALRGGTYVVNLCAVAVQQLTPETTSNCLRR